MQQTPNYSFNKYETNDTADLTQLSPNWDALDSKLKEVEDKANNAPDNSVGDGAIGVRTPDQAQAPATPGTGTLLQLVSWLANRIKAITGKANWWDTPSKNLEDVATHLADYTLQVPYGIATGAANTYAVTLNPAPTSLVAGMALAVKINVASTAASTLNVNGLGAKGIKKANGTDVTNLKANGIYTLRYDGTNFILQGEGASGNATASDLLLGKTATTDAGEITGTIPSKAAATITPGTTNQTIAANQFLSGVQTILGDADLIGPNIISGKTIFDVPGTATQVVVGSGTTGADNSVVVTGLPFQPTMVEVYLSNGVLYFYEAEFSATVARKFDSGSAFTMTVSSSGFTLQLSSFPNTPFTYMARGSNI